MKRWARSGPIYGSEGQSLVELAIFGGLLLMLLGVLISSGLNADFNQSMTMETFRRALKSAKNSSNDGQPTSTSYVVVQDRHVPNPNHPLALGSVIPFSGSAGVTRNYRMQEGPKSSVALPRITYVMQGQEYSFTTAGLRREVIADDPNLLDKYRLVYGGGSVCSEKKCLEKFGPPIGSLSEWFTFCNKYLKDPDTDEDVLDVETGSPICIDPVRKRNVVVVDSCAGEVINYDACVRQARMIVDQAVCAQECNKAGNVSSQTSSNANSRCTDACKNVGSDNSVERNQCITDCVRNITGNAAAISADCNTTCAATMAAPWYAVPYTPGGSVMFPTLAGLLPAGGTQMGLQPTMTQTTTKNNTLTRNEDAAGITSIASGTMSTQTRRTVRKVEGGQGVDQPIDSAKDVSTNTTWKVSW